MVLRIVLFRFVLGSAQARLPRPDRLAALLCLSQYFRGFPRFRGFSGLYSDLPQPSQRQRSHTSRFGCSLPDLYYGSRLLYAGVPENDVADWMGHSSTDVLREHYHYIFEGAEQRGRAAIATMLTPGADDPTEASEVA